MRCAKCGGLMNWEEFFSVMTESLPWSYKGYRCIDCGEIIDPIILQNRRLFQNGGEDKKLTRVLEKCKKT